jgi:hypothetical protein
MKFVPRIAYETGVSAETGNYAIELLRKSKEEKMCARMEIFVKL